MVDDVAGHHAALLAEAFAHGLKAPVPKMLDHHEQHGRECN